MRFVLVLLCIMGFTGPALSHPHVLVDAQSEITFDDQGRVTGVRHRWTFDDAFSAFAVQGLDEDQDGVYTREELAELADINVESLADFDYFTWIAVGEQDLGFDSPRDHWLEFEGGKLTLNFTLPLKQAIASNATELVLDVYDPEYYVAFSLAPRAVTLAGAPSRCGVSVDEPQKLDSATAAILMQIPADQRELPEDLSAYTKQLSNRARLKCT